MDLDRSPAFSFIRWFVRVSWVMVLIGMAVSLVILLVSLLAPGRFPTSTRPILELGFYSSSMTIKLPAGVVSPEFESRARPLVLTFALVEGGIAAVVLYELGRILDNMAEHAPFVMENANRIRFIGLAVLGAGVKRSSARQPWQAISQTTSTSLGSISASSSTWREWTLSWSAS